MSKILQILSNLNLGKYFDPSYIFETSPTSDGLSWDLLIIFGAFVLIAMIIFFLFRKLKYKAQRQIKRHLFNLFLTIGLVGILLWFFRVQQIPYIGGRFTFYLLALVFIVWGGWILYFTIFKLKRDIKKEQEKEKFLKYLPNTARNGNI